MAMVESTSRHRDALPSINHLDLDKAKSDRVDHSRFSAMAGLNISMAPLSSPTTIYSGPPPPYSYASTVTTSAPAQSGYVSPAEAPRAAVKDEKEATGPRQSLPSISEALGTSKAMAFVPSVTTTQSTAPAHQPLLTPSSAVGHSFPEGPIGPSNPFSQPSLTGSSLRDHGYRSDTDSTGASFSNLTATEPRPQHSQTFGASRSPKHQPGHANPQLPNISANLSNGHGPSTGSPGAGQASYRSPFAFSHQAPNPQASPFTPTSDPFRGGPSTQYDDQKRLNSRSGYSQPYGESVKRHLEVFDTQMAVQEIAEASAQNLSFARDWAQRAHQAPRTGYFPEVLPDLSEVNSALHLSNQTVKNLVRIREAVVTQQNALAEQRARSVKGDYYEDEYNSVHDDYKASAGFSGGDAKKRRGKAAPPGRCHSCNRAETPEWRRGPDGARTLCNACGLHYAKLTRKMGVNKASSLAGSSLRPKNHDPRSPHQ